MTEPIVKIKLGQLKGRIAQDINGGNYYSFQGIPYAKPPLGKLRFKAPQPVEPWTGIRDATVEGSQCFSRHLIFKEIIGSEDCLFLNVYTKELETNTKAFKPVMVFIHGGAYIGGSGNEDFYGPQFFMTQDVVFVTINYRLGVLGFLSLKDTSLGVPGNAGLKDQVLALKWIQEHIKTFGGDPNNVTIFGESAGAGSVHLLMLSPITKGLFHKVIAQSGSALNPWAIGKRNTAELAEVLNLNTTDEKKILDYLMKATPEEILKAQETLPDGFEASSRRLHGPVIEKSCASEPAIITEEPLDIILSGNYNKVPFMTGFTSREGMLFVVMANAAAKENLYRVNFEKMVHYALKFETGSENSLKVAEKIKKFYFGNQEASEETVDNNYVMKTDIFFLRGIYSGVKNHIMTSSAPVYLYKFSTDASLNLYKSVGQIKTPGACHADELGYMFKTVVTPPIVPDSVEDKTIRRMITYWTNFAKYSNPNPVKQDPLINVTWLPVKENEMNYVEIGDELKAGVNPEEDRMLFWDTIYKLNPAVSKL